MIMLVSTSKPRLNVLLEGKLSCHAAAWAEVYLQEKAAILQVFCKLFSYYLATKNIAVFYLAAHYNKKPVQWIKSPNISLFLSKFA